MWIFPQELPKAPISGGPEPVKILPKTWECYKTLQLPTIKELTSHIKLMRAEGKYHAHVWTNKKYIQYDFGEGLPLVDAQYLLDMFHQQKFDIHVL